MRRLTRIDVLRMPNIEGKSPREALRELYSHCHDVAELVMHMNNEVVALRSKVDALERRRL